MVETFYDMLPLSFAGGVHIRPLNGLFNGASHRWIVIAENQDDSSNSFQDALKKII